MEKQLVTIETPRMVWAFAQISKDYKDGMDISMYDSIKGGKSRFGWSYKEELDIRKDWSEHHSKNLFLRQIKPGDWIVHINTPEWGRCVAARVTSEYDFDEGILIKFDVHNPDFRHCFAIDTSSIVEFDRRDPNISPTVNLRPRGRYQRVYATADFAQSMSNILNQAVQPEAGERPEDHHLKEKTGELLKNIADLIQKYNKSKEFEKFLVKVFGEMPNVEVSHTGTGWGTDHGVDLILTLEDPFGFSKTVLVQAKSYTGKHESLQAVDDIRRGLDFYKDAHAGLIVTTADRSEELERAVEDLSKETGKEVFLMDGEDLVRFILEHSPKSIFKL